MPQSKDKLIPGFDYLEQKPKQLTKEQWKQYIKSAIAGGGRRRSEKGETFIHAKNSKIIAEIYEVIW